MEENKLLNIDLRSVIKMLIADKKKICIYAFVAGVIGVIFAFGTPKTYKSTVILAPEETSNGFSGSISSLASMVGMDMNIGNSGDAIYPEIYPDLMSSTDFVIKLFPVKVTTSKTGQQYTYQDYLLKHQKQAFYSYPIIWLTELLKKEEKNNIKRAGEGPNPFHLTKKEDDIVKAIGRNIDCAVDKKTNVITITVEDQDPLIAATIADSVKVLLQKTITDYRTKKARIDLEYMEQLYTKARQDYDEARHVYAAYADANQNVQLQKYKMKEADLENDMQLKYAIYQQVVEQRQLAHAKLQERTPAFTVIQGASVPIKHCNKSKLSVLITWMFLGFLLRTGILMWRNRRQFINL